MHKAEHLCWIIPSTVSYVYSLISILHLFNIMVIVNILLLTTKNVMPM